MDKIPSLLEMQRANAGKNFTAWDYVYFVAQKTHLTPDFIVALSDVLDPTFITLDGLNLIESIGALDKYQKSRAAGLPPAEAQYWANLLEATEFIGWVETDIGRRLAEFIARSWRTSLSAKSPNAHEHVRILNSADGEVFVTLAVTSRLLPED
jgi:hypothetical protein